MSKFILKPSDRQSIDFSEEERVKSQTNSGKIIHEEDIQNLAKKDFSNVTNPTLSVGNTSYGVCDRVVETYISSDGNTWYRKWASGWKECGGIGGERNIIVYFPVIFNHAPILNLTFKGVSSNNITTPDTPIKLVYGYPTTECFAWESYHTYNKNVYYYASGY